VALLGAVGVHLITVNEGMDRSYLKKNVCRQSTQVDGQRLDTLSSSRVNDVYNIVTHGIDYLQIGRCICEPVHLQRNKQNIVAFRINDVIESEIRAGYTNLTGHIYAGQRWQVRYSCAIVRGAKGAGYSSETLSDGCERVY